MKTRSRKIRNRRRLSVLIAGKNLKYEDLPGWNEWMGHIAMNIYLAGVAPWRSEGVYDKVIKAEKPLILESFYYCDNKTERLLPYYGDFLLDSGAFTFMMNSKKTNVNWDEYIEKYADFIKRNKVEKFFELDIDSIVGYEKVLEYRKKLEQLTGRQSIPVWHSNRGIQDFINACQNYPYVALGGIVGKEWSSRAEKYIPWFIKTAHTNGAKIHGLGYTRLTKLKKYHFDSVDSTSWTTGNRFGHAWRFDGTTMEKVDVPPGKRIKDSRGLALNNYTEWIKFQKYADTHL